MKILIFINNKGWRFYENLSSSNVCTKFLNFENSWFEAYKETIIGLIIVGPSDFFKKKRLRRIKVNL